MNSNCKSRIISRRTALIGAVGALPLIALGATGAKASKLTLDAVRYEQKPHDGKRCGACSFFVAPGSCKQVEGAINPNGYCLLWAAKA